MQRVSGRYISQQNGGEQFSAYIPKPLPPDPTIDYHSLEPLISEAAAELGRLDAVGQLIPEAKLFLHAYVRKEAVLSSQIEGTQSSLADLLLYENGGVAGVPEDDVVEVSRYVAAMEYGLKRLRLDGFPLSLRLIKEMHGMLMRHGPGAHVDAGEFRRVQNWIGGTKPGNAYFVPPPANEVIPAMGDLEKFLHSSKEMYPLITAGLAHAQFETIHPFPDGNGRLGRLLITLILCAAGVLQRPLLYLSLFFKDNRREYYHQLDAIRKHGDWEQWLRFYLTGVRDISKGAYVKARKIIELFANDAERVAAIRRGTRVAWEEFNILKERGMLSIPAAAKLLDTTYPTAATGLAALEEAGIVKEITGGKRDRIYAYTAYVDLLNKD